MGTTIEPAKVLTAVAVDPLVDVLTVLSCSLLSVPDDLSTGVFQISDVTGLRTAHPRDVFSVVRTRDIGATVSRL